MASSSSTVSSEVSQKVWSAIVGTPTFLVDMHIPKVNSIVYYYPEGLLEYVREVTMPEDFDGIEPVRCRVVSVNLRSTSTDNLFAVFRLQPTQDLASADVVGISDDEVAVLHYHKTLTGNECGSREFTIPTACRESIFSEVKLAEKEGGVINLVDNSGKSWEMIIKNRGGNYIISNKTWRPFVESKRLKRNDTVVFLKVNNQFHVGVRREKGLDAPEMMLEKFRASKTKAKDSQVFEISYFPKQGLPAFVISSEKVDKAMAIAWESGMKVLIHLADKTVEGRVEKVFDTHWNKLEVKWDTRVRINSRNVSPWHVELCDQVIPPPKRQKKEIDAAAGKGSDVKLFGAVIN